MEKFYYFEDEVEKGRYMCTLCGLELDMEKGESLDLCPICSGSKYQKLD